MGLLEKAQQKKHSDTDLELEREEIIEEKEDGIVVGSGLLAKAKQKKISASKELKTEGKSYSAVDKKGSGKKEIIEEKKGFGYKGLGVRRIVYYHDINEYIYEVDEPVLTEDEKEIKKEVSRLFKMLADINITGIDKEKQEKYLNETLGQIVADNNIKFGPRYKSSKKEKEDKDKIKLFGKKDEKGKTDKNEIKDKEKKALSKKPKLSLKELKEKKEEITAAEKESKERVFYHLFRDYIGYSRINVIMEDEGIEDISCDGSHVPIFIYHKEYDEITTNISFEDDKELNSFVVRLAQVCGKQISIYSPIVDGKLPDGSRLQTTLAKTVTHGSTFTIRRFKENPLTPIDLISFKSFSLEMAAYFWIAIENGASMLFCGGTAAGKTSALNALSLFIPTQYKIVSIEDTREINLPHKNWIAGTTRQGFSASDEKTGKDIDMFDLIRAALRQRPKVVMVGEVRGKEAYSLFQAMSTGHTAYATVHASSIHTLIQRLENPPIELPRALLTSLDLIVFQNAINMSGKYVRRMTSVTEIIKLDPDTNQLIFMEPFHWVSKTDDRFESSGTSKILNNIRLHNDWSEQKLQQELENRRVILGWMLKKDIRNYKEVGKIVSDYSKFPEKILKKAKDGVKN